MTIIEERTMETISRSIPEIVRNLEKQNTILNKIAEGKTCQINEENKTEFIGQIIDVFEDFLTEKNVHIDNPEREEAEEEGYDPETTAIIFGSDYDKLDKELSEMLIRWKVISEAK